MNIFPAIDLFDHKAVRLFKGDYNQMTIYSDTPWEIALDFKNQGASHIQSSCQKGAAYQGRCQGEAFRYLLLL